eukprot:g29655.t1
MDVVKRRLDPRSYVKLVGSVEGCCVAPLAALWTSPPASVRWDLAANAYPAPSGRKGPVVFAGSFNPPHHGHMEIIRYLSKAFSEVHIVIGMNPNKNFGCISWTCRLLHRSPCSKRRAIYPVSPETRKQIIEQALPFIGAGNAKVWVWGDVIFKLAQHVGASALYRGIRSWEEDGKAERYLEAKLRTCAKQSRLQW